MSARLHRRFLIAVILWLLEAVCADASVLASYGAGTSGAAPDPASTAGGSWTAGVPTADTGNFQSAALSPDGATGFNAWRMLDNSTAASQFITWNKALAAQQHADAASSGWRMSARLRVADPVASNGGANSVVLLYGNNAAKRWILFFDLNASGDIVTTMAGGPTVTLTGVPASAQNLHELVYNPATATAEYFVNGVSKAAGYAGTTGTYNGVQWGTGSTGGRGDGYWNSVTFSVNDPVPAVTPPSVTGHPVSQAVAAGGTASLTAAFANVVSLQWFKDAGPVPGATSATLSLPNLSAAQAGDYWCRATNANGTRETRTASLRVLQPGAEPEISEFLAENDHGLRDADGERQDWIELHNPSATAVNLAGWSVTDDPALPQKWAFPSHTLPPGGFVVVFASGKNRAMAGSELHTNFSLQNSSGFLALVRPDGSTAQSFAPYPQQFADISYGRTTHQPALVKSFAPPSPGVANSDGLTDARHGPSLSPQPGVFAGTQPVTVTPDTLTPAGGTLRYTTDGSFPTFDSPAVTGDLPLSATTNLRVAVVYPGDRYGATRTGAFLRAGSSVSSFSSPLPIVVLHNFGAGAIPGVSSTGPNGDGSNVVEVDSQAVNLTVLDGAAGLNTFSSPVGATCRAGLKLRGSSSFLFNRKSYALETWTEFDNESRDMGLLDLPADNDWVLYGPDPAQFDPALIHNSVAYRLAREAGYNAPRTRFVEVFLNTAGGDIVSSQNLGLYLLVEKPKRSKDRVKFDALSQDGARGGWMVNVNRMDGLPVGSTIGSVVPRHFHTAGPDGALQSPDDNPRGYQGITTPGGSGSGSGLTPATDDMPNYYHSFFNFESPGGWDVTTSQRNAIETKLRAFDTALYGSTWQDPVLGYAAHLDRKNWAQHLALQCFCKNQDAVVLSSFLYRETPSSPLRWGPIWDLDRAFGKNPTNGAATANTTWAHDRLHYLRLTADPEFMQAYVDAWQDMRRGAFADANLAAVVDSQTAEITDAVAARSGLASGALATNAATLKSWLTSRAAALDALYTKPAVFAQNGGSVPAGFSLTLSAPAAAIYYTTNGTDPRLTGGSVSPSATAYASPIPITATTTVTARVKNGTAWSGLTTATFYPPQDLATLRVTEIMYHPPGDGLVDGDEFEFLELQNTGLASLDLGGLSFSGITYTFPTGITLPPGAFHVLVRNPGMFASRYPAAAYQGVYSGKLDNGGETIGLLRGTETVWSFSYGDSGDWPSQADSGGFSLQRPVAAAPGYAAATWTAAAPSPGAALALADTDGNGLPDYFEALHGITDPGADDDGDGAPNLAEYLAGTNPRDPASVFKLLFSSELSGLRLDFTALAARSYSVQASDDLATWQKLLDLPASDVTRTETIPLSVASMKSFFRIVTPAVAGAAFLAPSADGAPVTLDPLFSENVVLQRETPLPIWGTASPHHEITVTFGNDSAATVAGADGRWQVKLPAKQASSTPRTLSVRDQGSPAASVNGVLVGDVWLCAGQSNMEFRADQEATWASEQAVAALPEVRFRNMGYAGQGYFATAYPLNLVQRQTAADFYNAATWQPASAASAAPFSAVGYFFAKEMRNALGVPVGMINCSVGGSPAEAWTRRAALAASPATSAMATPGWTSNNTALEPWCNGRALVQLGSNVGVAPSDDLGPNHSFKPSFLWDAGPARILPFAIRGVLWYQGESNALSHLGESGVTNPRWRVDQHEPLFPLMVKDWRKQWGQGDFPFLVCQLSSISETSYASDFWPDFRDQQRRSLSLLPNLGLAVTSDIGNSSNVHPTNKRDVGKRLAHWARKYVHGDASALPCPLASDAKRSGATVTVTFNDAGAALSTSNAAAPASFELAGADGVFYAATAVISGATVSVSSVNVPAPVKVRYAWQPYAAGNLVNAAGFPASTFQLTVTP